MSLRQTAAMAALQAALAARFAADPVLSGLVSGRIHDGAPRAAVPPWLAFAEARGRDFSGGEETGARIALAIEAVAADDERARAIAVLDRALALALDTPLALGGPEPVLVRLETTAVTRLRDGRGWRAVAVLDALVDG